MMYDKYVEAFFMGAFVLSILGWVVWWGFELRRQRQDTPKGK